MEAIMFLTRRERFKAPLYLRLEKRKVFNILSGRFLWKTQKKSAKGLTMPKKEWKIEEDTLRCERKVLKRISQYRKEWKRGNLLQGMVL